MNTKKKKIRINKKTTNKTMEHMIWDRIISYEQSKKTKQKKKEKKYE